MLYRAEEVLAGWRRIAAPVLWVEGANTDVTEFWGDRYPRAEFEARLAQVPHVERLLLEDCGHMLHHDQPAAVAERLRTSSPEARRRRERRLPRPAGCGRSGRAGVRHDQDRPARPRSRRRRAMPTPAPTATRCPARSARIPIGVGLGAAAAGMATGAAVASVAGPVGTSGRGGGRHRRRAGRQGRAEAIDPTAEDAYWRANYASRAYATPRDPYDDWGPAYAYGVAHYNRNVGRSFEDVESELERGWDEARGQSSMEWTRARLAAYDAWERARTATTRPPESRAGAPRPPSPSPPWPGGGVSRLTTTSTAKPTGTPNRPAAIGWMPPTVGSGAVMPNVSRTPGWLTST